jgi:hypothetical protein
MGRFNKEVKAFGKEFGRQGCILLFGKAPRTRSKSRPKKYTGAHRQYNEAQAWAKRKGFKK